MTNIDTTTLPLPFEDGSQDEMIFGLLHRMTLAERNRFFEEAFRVLKPGGRIRIVAPYFKSSKAWSDPFTQAPLFTEQSFLLYSKELRDQAGIFPELKCDFKHQNAGFVFVDQTWELRTEEVRAFAIRHYYDICSDIIVDMQKADPDDSTKKNISQ